MLTTGRISENKQGKPAFLSQFSAPVCEDAHTGALNNITKPKGESIMNLNLQRALEEDAQSIVDARNQSFYDDYVRFGECPGYHITPDEMRETIREADVYRILVDGKMVGDVSVHRPSDDGSRWIGCLEIIPEQQNGGIGSETLQAVFDCYPETKKWELETPVQNKRNCHFYEKAGFHGTRETVHSNLLTLRTYTYEK